MSSVAIESSEMMKKMKKFVEFVEFVEKIAEKEFEFWGFPWWSLAS